MMRVLSLQHQPLLAIGSLADHLDIRLLLEDQPKACADELMVVDKDDANHSHSPSVLRHESGL